MLRLKVTATAGTVLIATNSEAHIELGVVSLLLERKKAIIDRLRQLRAHRPINTLSDLIDTVSDQEFREQLLTELEAARQRTTADVSKPRIREGHAFVAMAMEPQDPLLEDVLDAIKEGAAKCNVTAERIDEALSNERITDRMLSSIGEAEFVVVDLTHARQNVYYEAGYAQGLGKTPVYVARAGTRSRSISRTTQSSSIPICAD